MTKFLIWIVSFILATAAAAVFFPGASMTNGGAGEMFVVIFLTVGFKATIDYFLKKLRKKREAKQIEKPSA
jgi:hypothetical protein